MEFLPLKTAESLGERYEAALSGIESSFAVSLTLHDLHGRLGDPHGNPLLPGRHLHPHECCTRGRNQNPQWNFNCNRDCYQTVEHYAGRRPAPFLKCCWKGLWELVVPIIRHERHQMTLFAGVFRSDAKPAAELPPWFAAAYERLPEIEAEKLRSLAQLLIFVGNGLLQDSETEEIPGIDGGRREIIYRFIKNRAHEDVGLADIAKVLYVSVSRAGHLVKECTGQTFLMLLEEERMMRARNMLLSSDRKLEVIAASAGYPNAYYFNRIFTRYFGMPPGRFRKSNPPRDI